MIDNYDYEEKRGIYIGVLISLVIIAIILISFLGVVGSFISTYNSLVDMQEDVNLAQANVQEKMQRRLELIPDLVETVQAYSDHEEKVFENIANARAALSSCLDNGTTEEISEANNKLSEEINNVLAFAEDYPELTAGEQYTSLMDQIEGSINRISVARETYNEEVAQYNKKVRKFPGFILASMFGFEEIEQFKADEAAEQTQLIYFNKK